MSAARGPVAPEVPALDEHVGGHHDVSVADAQHGRVVAGADEHVLALGEERAQRVDETELARVGQARVDGEGHGPSHQIAATAVRRTGTDRPVGAAATSR